MRIETAVAVAKIEPEGPPSSPSTEVRLEIRPARAGDLDGLLALENAVFATDRLSRRSYRRFLSGRTAILLVATDGGALSGYALVLLRRGAAPARLYSIAVDPGAQGRGIAAALMSACERAAAKRGATAMRLEVQVGNTRALKLYEKLGYRVFGRYQSYYNDGGDALRLEKALDDAAAAGVKGRRKR
ncbi:MAG: GNAT family N-acetyltransferase [Hyphomicrobiales bacterium]|nr:GNAT family N-acetyltransferase [Hyphomicrobiales bacterium]